MKKSPTKSPFKKKRKLQRAFMPMNLPNVLKSTSSEIKAIDIPFASVGFPTAGVATLLNSVLTGSGFWNRVGSKIEMKSVRIRLRLKNDSTSTQDAARVLLVYDRQANATALTISDLLQSRASDGTTVATNQHVDINLDNRDRFTIIRDQTLYLPSVTNTAGVMTNAFPTTGNDTPFIIDWYVKLKGLVTHYKASAGGITDITTGALYLVQISGGNNLYSLSGNVRLRYNDY